METINKLTTLTKGAHRRSVWWANRSLITTVKHEPTKILEKNPPPSRKRSSTFEKHTFFPGNEIHRIRYVDYDKFIITPDSHFKVLWDLTIVLFAVILSFTIPYSLSYSDDLGFSSLYQFVNILFIIDLMVQLNTAYSHRGHIIHSRKEILKNYMKTWMFVDILSGVPIDLILPYSNLISASSLQTSRFERYLWLLKLLKTSKFHKVIYKVQYVYAYTFIYTLASFFTTSFIVSSCIHLAACLYNILYLYSLDQGFYLTNNWTDNKTRHLHFLERAVQTVTSVGYGDVPLMSVPERLTASMLMICTSGPMGYFVGGITTVISKSNEKYEFYHDLMMKFKKYSNLKGITPRLRRKVLNYYRHLIHMSNLKILGEEQLLSVLSAPLKAQVNLHVRGFVLEKISIFKKYSKACVKALGDRMVIEMYSPNDLILKQGELTDELYFIVSGKVEIFHPQTRTTFMDLGEGNTFGEIAFFTGMVRKASARSLGFSELFCLSKFEYNAITKELPRDKSIGELLLRNFKTYGIMVLGIKCYFCSSYGHVAPDCPQSLITVSIDKIIRKNQIKRNKAPRIPCMIPARSANTQLTQINNYSLMNTKGKEIVYEFMDNSRMSKIIKRDYLKIYRKKEKCPSEVYRSDSEGDSEHKSTYFGGHKIDILRSRKERSSTILASNNFEVS